jgi:CubicO group peptidase (beta-lactamase class C family)
MQKLILIFSLITFFLASCSSLNSTRNPPQSSQKDFQDDKINERIKNAITPQIGHKNVGAIVAVYNRGKLDFLSFGETIRGNKTLPTPDTVFEIGSITKTFTGLMLSRVTINTHLTNTEFCLSFVIPIAY